MRILSARIFSKSFGGKIEHGQTDVNKEITFTKKWQEQTFQGSVTDNSKTCKVINKDLSARQFKIVPAQAIYQMIAAFLCDMNKPYSRKTKTKKNGLWQRKSYNFVTYSLKLVETWQASLTESTLYQSNFKRAGSHFDISISTSISIRKVRKT